MPANYDTDGIYAGSDNPFSNNRPDGSGTAVRTISIIPNHTFFGLGAGINEAAVRATVPQETQVVVASREAVIPILYGGPERIAGKLYVAAVLGTDLVLAQILCEGPIYRIGTNAGATDSAGIYVNDQAALGGGWVSFQKYLGPSSQATDPADPTLVAAVSGFGEKLASTAYLVSRIQPGAVAGFPRVVPDVYGLLVYDPRQNLLIGSNTIGSTGWGIIGTMTATQNAVGPYGAFSYAWTLDDNDAGAIAYTYQNITVGQNANTYVGSIKVKKGAAVTCGFDLEMTSGGPSVSARINPSTGATTGSGAGVSATDLGTYYLLSIPITNDNNAAHKNLQMRVRPDTAAAANTGANVFCEAQVRLSTMPVGYIETVAAAITQQTVWSRNAALFLGDFLANSTYGEGRTVNADSLAEAAEYCDQMCGDSANASLNEKRCQATIFIDKRQAKKVIRDMLRAYIPAWVNFVDDVAYIRVDKAGSVDHTFTSANIDQEAPPAFRRAGLQNTPNVVVVAYTDTTNLPWKTEVAEAHASPTERRVQRLERPGIRSYSMARRFAIEAFNHYALEDMSGEIAVFEEGVKVLPGDIVDVTDELLGGSAKPFRVNGVDDRGHGRWLLRLREYQPSAYSSTVETTPTYPDFAMPDASTVPAVAGVTLTADRRQESGVWVSRILVKWTPEAVWPYVSAYIVQLFDPLVAANYTWTGSQIIVTQASHGLALNDVVHLDFTSGGATADGGYSVTAVDSASVYRTSYSGSGTAGNVNVRKIREHVLVPSTVSQWLSQPVLLGVQYGVSVRIASTSGVVGAY